MKRLQFRKYFPWLVLFVFVPSLVLTAFAGGLRQWWAVKSIERHGGWVVYDYMDDMVRGKLGRDLVDRKRPGSDFFGTIVEARVNADSDARYLRWFPNLECVQLGNNITDSGIHQIEGLPRVWQLEVYDSLITDTGFRHVKTLPRLRWLVVCAEGMTDAGLEYLASVPKLDHLVLQGRQFTDKGLKHLQNLKALRSLHFRDTSVTGDGLQYLKGFSDLRALYINGSPPLADTAYEHLGKLTQLDGLFLSGTPVSLRGVDKLRQVFSRRTQLDYDLITPAGR